MFCISAIMQIITHSSTRILIILFKYFIHQINILFGFKSFFFCILFQWALFCLDTWVVYTYKIQNNSIYFYHNFISSDFIFLEIYFQGDPNINNRHNLFIYQQRANCFISVIGQSKYRKVSVKVFSLTFYKVKIIITASIIFVTGLCLSTYALTASIGHPAVMCSMVPPTILHFLHISDMPLLQYLRKLKQK